MLAAHTGRGKRRDFLSFRGCDLKNNCVCTKLVGVRNEDLTKKLLDIHPKSKGELFYYQILKNKVPLSFISLHFENYVTIQMLTKGISQQLLLFRCVRVPNVLKLSLVIRDQH